MISSAPASSAKRFDGSCEMVVGRGGTDGTKGIKGTDGTNMTNGTNGTNGGQGRRRPPGAGPICSLCLISLMPSPWGTL